MGQQGAGTDVSGGLFNQPLTGANQNLGNELGAGNLQAPPGIMDKLSKLLGDTPEERQKNLEALSKALGGFAKVAGSFGPDTTLHQRAMQFVQANTQPQPIEIPNFTPQIAAATLAKLGIG